MAHNIIAMQMNDFQNSVASIESKFDLIFHVTQDILSDLSDGK